jgi:hypothetical protein
MAWAWCRHADLVASRGNVLAAAGTFKFDLRSHNFPDLSKAGWNSGSVSAMRAVPPHGSFMVNFLWFLPYCPEPVCPPP